MIKNANVRKFQFFELIKESSTVPPEDPDIDIEGTDTTTPIHLLKSNISVNNISPSGARQMHAIDGLIFLNGKAIHKKEGKNIRESLIMKIYDNKIIDEYRIYNGVYYDFSVKVFEDKTYFVVTGGNFNEYMIDGNMELFMTTSIKIYDATSLIEDKTGRYPVPQGLGPTDEPYPQLLVKRIKLLKRLSDEKLVCDTEGDKMEGYESFQNINAFSISDSFTHAAVSLDKGGILLIYGYPNLLECNTKEMKMIYLPKIMQGDREAHITNLDFSELLIKNEMKRILYASTANSVYFYEWKLDLEKNSNAESKIKLIELNQDGKGAYSGCITVKGKYLLMGSSNDDFIAEYDNLDFGKTWFFDGKKTIVKYFKDYILFVILGENESSLQVYDRKNQFFVFFEIDTKKITGVCSDDTYLYVLYEETPVKKYIAKYKEKENKEKFRIFFEKKFYDTASIYAENLGFDKTKIAQIAVEHAEYEYSKGDFDRAIDEYIKTINFYEPSIVVQKFLEKSKLDYLIKYLEAIVYNIDFKIRDVEEHINYASLLLNCYIMQEKIPKLKEFIDKKGQYFSQDLINTAIDVCLETQNVDLALSVAKQNQMVEKYIQILIVKQNNLSEALKIMSNPEKYDFQINNDDKINVFCKFGEHFLQDTDNKEGFADKFFDKVTQFIEDNISIIDKKDIDKLIKIFVVSDKYFKILFEKMNSYKLALDKDMIHRRIELYLEDSETKKEEQEQIIKLLKDERFIGKYDNEYLMMLFRYRNFIEGLETIAQIQKLYQEKLYIYMDKKQYDQIIKLCADYGMIDPSFWGMSLQFFIDKKKRESLPKEEIDILDKYLQEFLMKILDSNVILSVNVLDIINEQNTNIPISILNNFMNKALEKELSSIEENKKSFNDYDTKLQKTVEEIKDLKTKAYLYNLSKCDECSMPINIPTVAFECGHCFHFLCLNANSSYNKDKVQCPKCREAKVKAAQEIKKSQAFYDTVNSQEKLEKEMDKNGDKVDYMHKLFGKGLFHLGPVREIYNKE